MNTPCGDFPTGMLAIIFIFARSTKAAQKEAPGHPRLAGQLDEELTCRAALRCRPRELRPCADDSCQVAAHFGTSFHRWVDLIAYFGW